VDTYSKWKKQANNTMKIRVISDVFKRGKINQTTAIARTSIVS